MEAPDLFARLHIECRNEAADAHVAAGRTDDHLVLDDQRRVRNGVSLGRARDGRIPDQPAAFGVDREQMRVDRAHEERVAKDSEPAIDAAAAGSRVRRGLMRVRPEHTARDRVEGDDIVGRLNGIENAIDDEGRRLEFFERARLPHPLQLQVPGVGRRDLRERAEALVEQRARVTEPVLGLPLGVQNAIERDLRLQARQPREIPGGTVRTIMDWPCL